MGFLGGESAFRAVVRDGTDFATLDAGQVDLLFRTSGTNAGDSRADICLDNDFSPDGRAPRCARTT
jgi:hypothetical protein